MDGGSTVQALLHHPEGEGQPPRCSEQPARLLGQFQQAPGPGRLGAAGGRAGLVEGESTGPRRQERFWRETGVRVDPAPVAPRALRGLLQG